MRQLALEQPPPLDLAAALRATGCGFIAEVKKASPSKGLIRPDFDPVEIARTYAANGAAAISVLTETNYFQGSLDYLEANQRSRWTGAHRLAPCSGKDFIFDPYQVYESRAYGADAVLLIVAILTPAELTGAARSEPPAWHGAAWWRCIMKRSWKRPCDSGARIIGINNRDLETFDVDLATTRRLRPLIPPDRIVVSESGIRTATDIGRLRKLGCRCRPGR